MVVEVVMMVVAVGLGSGGDPDLRFRWVYRTGESICVIWTDGCVLVVAGAMSMFRQGYNAFLLILGSPSPPHA